MSLQSLQRRILVCVIVAYSLDVDVWNIRRDLFFMRRNDIGRVFHCHFRHAGDTLCLSGGIERFQEE